MTEVTASTAMEFCELFETLLYANAKALTEADAYLAKYEEAKDAAAVQRWTATRRQLLENQITLGRKWEHYRGVVEQAAQEVA